VVLLVVVSARRVVHRGNSPVVAAPCTRRATSPLEAPQEQLARASASALASVLVLGLADHAPEWVAPPVLFHLRVKLRVHSVQVARSVVAVSNTQRPKKGR